MAQWYYRNEPGSSTLNDEQSAALADSLNISPFLMDNTQNGGGCAAERKSTAISTRLSRAWSIRRNGRRFPTAADFLVKALLEGRQLAVWGDYDVDGTTSTAIVLDVLEFHGFHPLWHIPDRHTEATASTCPPWKSSRKRAARSCSPWTRAFQT